MPKRFSRFALAAVCVTGCATPLDPGAAQVRTLTSAAEKSACESLGIVSASRPMGLDKQASAVNEAINEVARRGGDTIFFIHFGVSGLDGSAVTAEALKCAQPKGWGPRQPPASQGPS